MLKRLARRYGLRSAVLIYFGMLVVIPVGSIAYRAFAPGFVTAWNDLVNPDHAGTSDFIHAFVLTLLVTAIAVLLNAVFGVAAAIVLARRPFWGSRLFDTAIDLPVAVSPVVVGLALVLVYGKTNGWFGGWLAKQGIEVIFSVPGIVIASAFISIPYVARAVLPVLQEIGTDQEEAAATLGAKPWQIFWRVTLPSIRWGVAYGVTITAARVLGEFGAVSVVSGSISGRTQTLTLYVGALFDNFDTAGADMGALLLAVMTLAILGALSITSAEKGSGSWRSRFKVFRRSSARSLPLPTLTSTSLPDL